MAKTLPKGHISCLSSAFRYTPAVHTNVADTFARIAREQLSRPTHALGAPHSRFVSDPLVPAVHTARRLQGPVSRRDAERGAVNGRRQHQAWSVIQGARLCVWS